MKVYEYPDNEQTDLTGGKFGGVLSPYNEDEQNDYSMIWFNLILFFSNLL